MLVWASRYLVIVVLVAGAFAVLKANLGLDGGAWLGRRAAADRAPPERSGSSLIETVLEPDPKGHYWARTMVNGAPVTFMIDTGASDVILAPKDARRLGFATRGLRFDRRYSTANGVIEGALVRLRELRIGQQSVYDLDAVVVDAPLTVSLLGMDFLRRLDGYEVRSGQLVLRW